MKEGCFVSSGHLEKPSTNRVFAPMTEWKSNACYRTKFIDSLPSISNCAPLRQQNPGLITQTWPNAMESLVAHKCGTNKKLWLRANNDPNFDTTQNLPLIETLEK
jgi:hypothetical protein